MSTSTRFLFLFLLAISLGTASCTKKSNPTAPPDSNTIPQGMARIAGTVKDAAGNPLNDVALHLVYQFSEPSNSPAAPMVSSSVTFYDADQVLYTECGGTTPLSDSVMVKIFWDRNSSGPDSTDPQPPLCADPPDCPNGEPPFTVNLTEFPVNGVAEGIGAGLFVMTRDFSTNGDVLSPNRYYCRIYCSDGSVLYTSQVVDVPPGSSQTALHFTCTPCSGAPGVPAWQLGQAYPNPATDSVTVPYGLHETASTLLTLTWPGSSRTDSIVHATFGTGNRTAIFRLGSRPNGLYTLRLQVSSFDRSVTLLKNVSNPDVLSTTDAAVRTPSDGSFALTTPAGTTIANYGASGNSLGTLSLTRVKVIAIRSGYFTLDTTLSIASQQNYPLDLRLISR
ncbi:MAG TPA: hypothetical protein VGL38_00690 [bacterium]|jgi:hypothetical protein